MQHNPLPFECKNFPLRPIRGLNVSNSRTSATISNNFLINFHEQQDTTAPVRPNAPLMAQFSTLSHRSSFSLLRAIPFERCLRSNSNLIVRGHRYIDGRWYVTFLYDLVTRANWGSPVGHWPCMALFTIGMPRAYIDTRLDNIPHDVTRKLRHGPNARKDEVEFEMDMEGGNVLVSKFLQHPTMRSNSASEEDMRRLTQDISPRNKERLDMFFDEHRDGYRMRAINGHSLKIGKLGRPPAMTCPGLFTHGTTVEASHEILRSGIKSMNRNATHLVDYWHSTRQAKYLFHPTRKGVWLAIDGQAEAHASVQFAKLPNEVVATTGTAGTLPPCLVTSAWGPNKNGAT